MYLKNYVVPNIFKLSDMKIVASYYAKLNPYLATCNTSFVLNVNVCLLHLLHIIKCTPDQFYHWKRTL